MGRRRIACWAFPGLPGPNPYTNFPEEPVFDRGFALRGARIVAKEAFKLLDLALLHLADGVAHDLLLVLVSAAARRFRITKSSCPCLSKEYGP